MKIFISQPMTGKTEEEIFKEKDLAIKRLKEIFGEDIEILHSYSSENKPALYLLGEALKIMSEADAVMFLDGWEKSKGCQIEYECARRYNIVCLEIGY